MHVTRPLMCLLNLVATISENMAESGDELNEELGAISDDEVWQKSWDGNSLTNNTGTFGLTKCCCVFNFKLLSWTALQNDDRNC